MTSTTKIILLVLILGALLTALIFGLKSNSSSENKTADNQSIEKQLTSETSKSIDKSMSSQNQAPSIASEWRWIDSEAKDAAPVESNQLFTRQSVHDALQAVRIDEYGDIILDNEALFALDEALERIHNQLDKESLQALLDTIKEALPGKVGEQTAQLVSDYYDFLGAQAEFNQLHQYTNTGPQTVATIEQDRGLYSELQTLRELHLGTQTAQSLFQEVNTNAQFMFDMLSLDVDTSLTPEQAAQRRQEIQARYNEQMANNQSGEHDSGEQESENEEPPKP